MHDLLQEMGKEIIRQESPKEAGERSRLWFHEDVRHVLEENTATNKIEAMLLDFPVGHDKIDLHPDAFGKMSNLRLFINQNAQFSTGPNYLSNQIRLLDWPHYPSSSLPSNFRGDNLVEFQMSDSLIKELGGLKFKNLTDMDLSYCEFITRIPDLSSSPNLKNLDLEECSNLVEVHHSIGLLDKLKSFDVMGCRKLRILPKRFKLRSLRNFDFKDCSSLEDFPEIECEMEFLDDLSLTGTSIKKLPSSIENFKGLISLYMYFCSIIELPSSIVNLPQLQILGARGPCDPLRSVCIVKVDGYSQPINIGKVEEEDGIQSTSSIVTTGKYEIASTTPTNSSIFNDAGSSSSAIWKSLEDLELHDYCLSESNLFTYINYFPALKSLNLSGSDIVIFPTNQGIRFPSLEYLILNGCKKLEEILPFSSNIKRVEANGCTSLESFAPPSEILTERYRWYFYHHLVIQLQGCHKLLAIPSWEEGLQSLAYRSFDLQRIISIIFPRMRIPSWFSYRMEAHDSNLCEIDINPPHHWNGKDEIIVIYVVCGFRSVGIIEPRMKMYSDIHVQVLDGSDWRGLWSESMNFGRDVSEYVWMHVTIYQKKVGISRFRIKYESEVMAFRSVGIHFLKKHSSISELENDELENDNENPNEDLELEKDDGNPNEIFGKRRCDDEYDCNVEPNRCPQQKRSHSSTMGITITELENEDEYPNEDKDLEFKLGL
ncbi:hypothetical protein I3760_16G113400 [Carya illinoinensis]|nr:hypothetical protein I3760_16G113400 [Carya illinoinensis]